MNRLLLLVATSLRITKHEVPIIVEISDNLSTGMKPATWRTAVTCSDIINFFADGSPLRVRWFTSVTTYYYSSPPSFPHIGTSAKIGVLELLEECSKRHKSFLLVWHLTRSNSSYDAGESISR